jgi:M6 family metalloprotease-like protein
MRSIILFWVFGLLLNLNSTICAPAYPHPISYALPDGTVITIKLKGDEKVKWAQTIDGYSILINQEGFYEYAILDVAGNMQRSGVLVSPQNQRTPAETAFIQSIPKDIRFSSEQVSIMRQIWEVRKDMAAKSFPTTGNRKAICILIGFTDLPFSKNHYDFSALFNQIGYNYDGATGSFRDYYLENSYGQLDITFDVVGPYTASQNMAYYGANDSNGYDVKPRELVQEAIDLADPHVDYSQYTNEGTEVQGLYVIYAGYGEEAGGPANAIWAHAWHLAAPIVRDGVTLHKYGCSAELRGYSGTEINGIGMVAHEFGHLLGAPDFYDTDYTTGGWYDGTGFWDLMADGSWNDDGTTPAHHNAYTKTAIYGWANPTIIVGSTTVTLANSTENGNSFYRINTTTSNEYYLLENRWRHKFDSYIPGDGMLIYHVHSNIVSACNNNTVNQTHPQMMYPVAQDLIADQKATGNYGGIFYSTCTWPGAKSQITDATTPNLKSWAGNNTNRPITRIKMNNTSKTITFDISGGDPSNPSNFFATPATNQVNLNWNMNPSSDPVLLVWTVDGVFGTPVDGNIYSVGASIPGGGEVVFSGPGTSFSHSGLDDNTTYYYKIWSDSPGNVYSTGSVENATTACGAALSLPLYEDFSEGMLPPRCWTIVDQDGDGHNWFLGTKDMGYFPQKGDNCAVSISWYNGSFLAQDNWLISPRLNITSNAVDLKFWVKGQDPNWAYENFSVLLSNTGNLVGNFTTTLYNGASSAVWTEVTVPVIGYQGQQIYLALRHSNSNQFQLLLDNISIEEVPDMYYASSEAKQHSGFLLPGTNDNIIIGIEVEVEGAPNPINITGFKVNANGTDDLNDISNAKLYYTGTFPLFGTGSQFGGTVPNPATADFDILGFIILQPGTNYFWLTFDVNPGATPRNIVDAECVQVTVNGVDYVPTVSAPAGVHRIAGSLSGDYSVGISKFNMVSGRNVYFEKATGNAAVEEEETKWVPMEDGKPYTGSLYFAHNDKTSKTKGTFATITEAINDLNFNGATNHVRFLLEDATYSAGENFPLTVNVSGPNLPAIDKTITLKPSTGISPTISGSVIGNVGSIFEIFSDYFIIDGSNTDNGATRDLTIENTSINFPRVIRILSWGLGFPPIYGVEVHNTNIINGAQTNTAISIEGNGATAGYFNNIRIVNNSIQRASVGVSCMAVGQSGNGNGLHIEGNYINSSGALAIKKTGIHLEGVDGATVLGNKIGNFNGMHKEIDKGIWLDYGTINTTVEANEIYNLNYTGVEGAGSHGICISSGTFSNNEVKNNVIYNITGDGQSYTGTDWLFNPMGIVLSGSQSGISLYHNSINLYGNTLNKTNAVSVGIAVGSGSSVANSFNNNVVNNLGRIGSVGHGAIGIWVQTSGAQLLNIDHNNYEVNPSGSGTKAVAQYATTPQNLPQWQAHLGMGKESNSLNVDPLFIANNNLMPQNTTLNTGVPIFGIHHDILGTPRHPIVPTIGAYEMPPGELSWTGATDNDWHTTGNWSPAQVPTERDNATIPAGLTRYPTINSPATCYNLNLRSSSTSTATFLDNQNLTMHGAPTVERFIARNGWHFISSPTSNMVILGSDFAPNSNPLPTNFDLYYFDETVAASGGNYYPWINVRGAGGVPNSASFQQFVPGRGYMAAYDSSYPVSSPFKFRGIINTGNVNIKINNSSANDGIKGWNLLGNPYPSAFDWDATDKSQFQDFFAYIYNPILGGGGGYTAEDEIIGPHQGFFALVKDGYDGQNFVFDDNKRLHGGSFVKNNSKSSNLKLKLTLGQYYDEARIRIKTDSEFDRDPYDALKLFSFNPEMPQLFSLTFDDIQVSINSIPHVPDDLELFVGLRAPGEGQYKLEMIENSGTFNDVDLFLLDTQTGSYHNFNASNEYEFTSSEGTFDNRFKILFFNPTNIQDPDSQGSHIYVWNNHLFVNFSEDITKGTLRVYDVGSRLVMARELGLGSRFAFALECQTGIYLVHVASEQGVVVQRVFVR